jgi:hypothetical protein
VADHVREKLALRIRAEKAGAHVDAGEAIAVRREARDLLVRKAGPDRQALEALAVLEQLLEAAAIARSDLDERRELVDRAVEILDLARRDLERVSRVVGREHGAVAIDDDAAVRYDRQDRDAVRFGEGVVVIVHHHLEIEKAREEHPEHHEDESRRDPQAHTEMVELAVRIAHFDAGRDVELRHGRGRRAAAAGASAEPRPRAR